MSPRHVVVLSLLAPCGPLACTESGAPSPADSPYAAACRAALEAQGAVAGRCGYTIAGNRIVQARQRQPQGAEADARECAALAAMFEAQVTPGAIAFDLAALSACIEAAEAEGRCSSGAPSRDLLADSIACPQAVKGLRAAGETCRSDAECGEGLYCRAAGCEGTCERALGAGETCAGTTPPVEAPCARGTYCDWQDHTCHRVPGRGEPCGSGPGVCAPETICHEGRCRVVVVSTASPPTCGIVDEGTIAVCPAGHVCAGIPGSSWLSGACSPVPAPAVGTTCYEDGPCLPDLRCDIPTHSCAPWLGEGDDCSGQPGDPCVPGTSCDGERCAPFMTAPAGAPCARGANCETGLCVGGECMAPIPFSCPAE